MNWVKENKIVTIVIIILLVIIAFISLRSPAPPLDADSQIEEEIQQLQARIDADSLYIVMISDTLSMLYVELDSVSLLYQDINADYLAMVERNEYKISHVKSLNAKGSVAYFKQVTYPAEDIQITVVNGITHYVLPIQHIRRANKFHVERNTCYQERRELKKMNLFQSEQIVLYEKIVVFKDSVIFTQDDQIFHYQRQLELRTEQIAIKGEEVTYWKKKHRKQKIKTWVASTVAVVFAILAIAK